MIKMGKVIVMALFSVTLVLAIMGVQAADTGLLQQRIVTLEAAVASLQTQLGTANTNNTTLQNRLATDENTIQSLLSQLATAQSNINSLQTQLAAANTSINNLFIGLAQDAAAIAAINAKAIKFSYARVFGNGNVAESQGLVSVDKTGFGDYNLNFTSDVTTGCLRVATIFFDSGEINVALGNNGVTSMFVNTHSFDLIPLDHNFIAGSICPAGN